MAVDDEVGLTAVGADGVRDRLPRELGAPQEQEVFPYPYGARNDTLVMILADYGKVPRGWLPQQRWQTCTGPGGGCLRRSSPGSRGPSNKEKSLEPLLKAYGRGTAPWLSCQIL